MAGVSRESPQPRMVVSWPREVSLNEQSTRGSQQRSAGPFQVPIFGRPRRCQRTPTGTTAHPWETARCSSSKTRQRHRSSASGRRRSRRTGSTSRGRSSTGTAIMLSQRSTSRSSMFCRPLPGTANRLGPWSFPIRRYVGLHRQTDHSSSGHTWRGRLTYAHTLVIVAGSRLTSCRFRRAKRWPPSLRAYDVASTGAVFRGQVTV